MRKVDMSAYNKSKPSIDYRQLLYYQPLGPIPPTDYNLHACAHLYASDRNSLWVVSNALGFSDSVGNMASLSHSVVFHVSSKELVLREGEWWCQESWTPRSGGGRAMHESRIWGPSGVHVASSWQDGLVRRAEDKKGEKQRIMWFENMKRLGKIPGERGGKEKL
jgi:acyl-CoA thioesterase